MAAAAMEARLSEIMQGVGDTGIKSNAGVPEVQDENADHNVQRPSNNDEAPKKEKKLEPSMQAWMASRNHAGRAPVNVAASEMSVGSVETQALRHRRRDSGISLSKSSRHGYISSEVQQQMRVEEARRQQSERVRRNAANCLKAIHNPELATRSDKAVTVPHEFNLSVSHTRHHPAPSSGDEPDVYVGEGGRDKVWKTSLRGEGSAPPTPTRGRSRSSSKQPELTVPQGPRLRTASRSCSRSSSVGSGVESACSTPLRSARSRSRSSSRSATPLPAREKAAVEEYLLRMQAARTPSESPRRGGRMETPSPARSVSRGRGSWTPLRSAGRVSQSAPCTPRQYSVSSRLSELSRRTPLRGNLLSSQDQQLLHAEEWREKLHKLRLDNARSWREAKEAVGDLAGVGRSHAHNPELTVPQGPALRTDGRGSRSRSSSRQRSVSRSLDTASLTAHAVPKSEQRAMEKHVERIATATEERPVQDPLDACSKPASGATTQELRAERARAVVLSKRMQQESEEKARLCVFKSNAAKDGAARKAAAAAGQKPNFVFKTAAAASKDKPSQEPEEAPAACAVTSAEPQEEPAAAGSPAPKEDDLVQASEAPALTRIDAEEEETEKEELSPLELPDKDGEAVMPVAVPSAEEEKITPRTVPEPRSLFGTAQARPTPTSRLGEPTRAKPSAGYNSAQAGLKRPGFAAAAKSKALR